MSVLRDDIVAFDQMRPELEARHRGAWVVFHQGRFVGIFEDYEGAATTAVERFEDGPYLIRQIGVEQVQLPGGMVFTPAHVLGSGRI